MLNERQIPTRKGNAQLGAIDGVGDAAQSGVPRKSLLWQDRTAAAAARSHGHCVNVKGLASRDSANHERPRQEWIEVPVPALVSEAMFALAQEQLQQNKHHSPRRTVEPTLAARDAGVPAVRLCVVPTRRATQSKSSYYYRCIGSDGYRRLKGPVCTNRPVRQDSLDQVRVGRDHPLAGRSDADPNRDRSPSRGGPQRDPLRKREEELRREQARLEKNIERLVTAYQEGLVTLPQLRQRHAGVAQTDAERSNRNYNRWRWRRWTKRRYLQLAESLATFRSKLRARAETLEVRERQRILRLVIKEVLVGSDTLTLCHSIPVAPTGSGTNGSPAPTPATSAVLPNPDYLLRTGRSWLCPAA